MPFKTLIDQYFDNKVRTIPSGAGNFFGYLDELEYITSNANVIGLKESDLQAILSGAEKITIIAIKTARVDRINKRLKWALSSENGEKRRGAFFYVLGNAHFTLNDVNDTAEAVYPFLKKDAAIIFGAAADNEENTLIRLFAVMTE